MLQETGLTTTKQLSHAQKSQTSEGKKIPFAFVSRRQNARIRQEYSDKRIVKIQL